jgi:hypothetical protein
MAVVAFTSPAPASASQDPNPPWPQLLPPRPLTDTTQPGPTPRCHKATMRCIDDTIRKMRKLRAGFGCDHRAVFATTYLELTKVMRSTMRKDPKFFKQKRALIFEDVSFANIYFKTLDTYAAGQPVDPAWQIALDTAAGGDGQGAGDMLLGINAHVQNDMPFMLAALTLRDAKGNSRKPDHDRENEILNDAFDNVVKEISRRYDPLTAYETHDLSPATDVFGIELVKGWRENVWRNAERLVNAKDETERAQVADSIHLEAQLSAELMQAATVGPPGYRASRDAYCAAALS